MMKTNLLLMLLLAFGLVAGTAQANMLKNPSFEDGAFYHAFPPAYWSATSTYYGTSALTWLDDAAGAHSGSKYIKMNTWAAWYSSSGWIWQTVDVTEGQEYAFSVWAKCPLVGETSEAWGYYEWMEPNEAIISEDWLPLSLDVGISWTHVEFGTVTAPASATRAIYTLVGVPANYIMGVLYDDACISTPLPSLPSPPWESLVPVGDVDLSWTNMDPNDPSDSVYVKVLFGTEPNETEPLLLAPSSGQDVTTVTVEDLAIGTYYWQVKSYIYGDPAEVDYDTSDPNDPNAIKGYAWSFDVVADAPPSSLDAGVDIITWSDEPVNLDATLVDDGVSELTYVWSSHTLAGTDILFSDPNVEDPNIIIKNVSSSHAAIVNPSFENGLTGWDTFGGGWIGTWSGTWMGKDYLIPTDGLMVVSLDGLHGDPCDGTWLTQTLTRTLTTGRTYTLTVDVINDGAYREDVEYKVQLLAGENVVAEDDDSWPLLYRTGNDPASDWQTSTVVCTVGGPSDPNFAYVGQPLGIRLVTKATTEEMTFDNVQLTAYPEFPPPEFSTVELTLRANDEANPTYVPKDTMTIDVYSDSCAAAKAAGRASDNPGDVDADCDTDLADLAEMAEAWLNDTSLTEAFAKQTNQTPLPPAGLIDNSGFEVPDQGDSGYTDPYPPTEVDGWTFTGDSGLSGPNGTWKCDSTSPDPLGGQFAFMQGSAAISQDLTGLAIDGTYQVSFFESYRTGTDPNNDLAVILDEGLGAENIIYYSGGVNNTTWQERQSSQFIAAKDSYILTFRTTNPLDDGDRSTIIDGVKIYDPLAPTVDAGNDMIALSGQAVQLAPTVVNNSEPPTALTYAWTTDPDSGVVFSPSAIVEAPTVTITKATLDPSPITLTLAVNNEGSVEAGAEDSLTIDLYNDACLATITAGLPLDPTDFDADCITGLADFAGLAETWLEEYSLTGPVPKP